MCAWFHALFHRILIVMKQYLFILIAIFLFSSNSQAQVLSARYNKKSKELNFRCNKATSKVRLSLEKDLEVEKRPNIYGEKDFNIVTVELADHNSGTTFIYALNENCRVLWKKDLKSFNPSIPLIEKDHVYLGAVGSVWKLNKKDGKVVWSHTDLYEKYKFNGVDPIRRKGSKIRFSDSLLVSDSNGKIGGTQ